jgi:hypothetical protein
LALEKKAIVEEAKKKPCADCKNTFPLVAMDFDHVRGEKSFLVSTAWRWTTKQKLIQELEKCDVVCSNCHRVRTSNRPHQKPGRKPKDIYLSLAEVPLAPGEAEVIPFQPRSKREPLS